MKLDHLHGFVGVADAGTIRKAARDLNIGQPALSRKIQALEHELGVELFVRSPGGAELTPAGYFLLTRTKALLADLARTKRDMSYFGKKTGQRPEVTITFGTTYALAQVLFPDVARRLKQSGIKGIDVRYLEQTTEQLHRHIESGALDIALMSEFLPGRNHTVTRLVDDPLCLVSPPEHDKTARRSIAIAEAAKLPIIAYHSSHSPRVSMDFAFESAGIDPDIELEAGSLSTILSHVRHGFGHGVIPLSSLLATNATRDFSVAPIEGMSVQRNLVSRLDRARAESDVVKHAILAAVFDFLGRDQRFGLEAYNHLAL